MNNINNINNVENVEAIIEKEKVRKHKAVIASQKSRAKRIAAMTEDELKTYRKKLSEASVRSHAKRKANATPEQLAEMRKKACEASKKCRAAKKAREAVAVAEVTVNDNASDAEQKQITNIGGVINAALANALDNALIDIAE